MKCLHCGKEFESYHNLKKYCSLICGSRYRNSKREKIKGIKKDIKKICKTCGQEFIIINNSQKYCSVECREKRNKKVYSNYYLYVNKTPTIYFKVCPICEKDFVSKYVRKLYCSKACKMIVDKEASDLWRKNNPEKASLKDSKRWLKKQGITELSEKGKKAKITKDFNKKVKNMNLDDLLNEFGDIE